MLYSRFNWTAFAPTQVRSFGWGDFFPYVTAMKLAEDMLGNISFSTKIVRMADTYSYVNR